MFFRLALLAILTVTTACEKQRRTIVSGFKSNTLETTTKPDSKATNPEIGSNDQVVESTEREKLQKVETIQAGVAISDPVIEADLPEDIPSPAVPLRESEALTTFLDALFDKDTTKVLRDQAAETALNQAIEEINTLRSEEGREKIESINELEEGHGYSDILNAQSQSIDSRAGELLKSKILTLQERIDCADCLLNFESLEISIDNRNNVIISNFALNEEYQNEEKFFLDGALPEFTSLEKSNEAKATLLSQIHYNEISFAAIDEENEFEPQADISHQFKFTDPI